VGDEVLRGVASAMDAVVRESELLARYGGEEFCLVLPQSSPDALAIAAERLRASVEAADISADGSGRIRVTVSLGGACLGTVTSAADGERLVGVADRKLYEAKDAGRNRFAIEPQLV
jgi:diguanylate cyclase (GGDEF)-like protein